MSWPFHYYDNSLIPGDVKQLVAFAYSDVSLRLKSVVNQAAMSSKSLSSVPLRIRRSTICCPYYVQYPGGESLPYEAGTAWAIRSASVIVVLAFVVGMEWLCRHVFARIRAQWCRFAKRITVSMLIVVSTLGTLIKAYLKWNTVTFFFVLFIVVMKVLHRLEISYTRAHKSDEWEHIKDHNDKSYYVTYYIYRFLARERGQK